MMRNGKNDEILVSLRNLTKKFGSFTAVSNINLDIYKGEIVGFLGPNGAGKSTTMKMMAKLLKPTSGEVLIRDDGALLKLSNRTKDRLLDNIGFLIENPAFYDSQSPRQILSYFAKLKGYPRDKITQRVEEVVAMVNMTDWIDTKIGKFSKGMRQKIGVISAIVHDPDIVVLDEPQTGLDPRARKEVRDFILKLKEMGKTIFISSHLLFEISEVADRVAIISNGVIIAFDTLDNLEAIVKKSVIRMEMLNPPENNSGELVYKINKIVEPLTGLINENGATRFNPDTKIFEIKFDGNSDRQFQILEALLQNGIKVIEFSVPKAGLLEDLYLDFVKDSRRIKTDKKKKLETMAIQSADKMNANDRR